MSESTPPAEGEKKKGSAAVWAVPTVVVLMALEAVAVYLLVSMTGPNIVRGDIPSLHGEEEVDQPLEILMIDAPFQNEADGRRWRWELEVVMLVPPRHRVYVDDTLAKRGATIRERIAAIVGKASKAHLTDPDRATLKKQLHALCIEIFGVDGDREPRVVDVLVPRLDGAVGDF